MAAMAGHDQRVQRVRMWEFALGKMKEEIQPRLVWMHATNHY